VDVVPGERTTATITLESRLAVLAITATPAGAIVYVDGRRVGVAPMTLEVEEGDHQLRIEGDARSYEPWSERVTAVRKVTTNVDAKLVPVVGSLLVLSTPFEALVRIDGEPEGLTPLKVPEILGGSHRLEVTKDGFQTLTREVVIEGAKANRLELTLVELLPAERAARRLADWEANTMHARAGATVKTVLAVVASGAAILSAVEWVSTIAERDAAWGEYAASRAGGDIDGLYSAYDDAFQRSRAWAIGAGAGALAAGWFGWRAYAGWRDVAPKPVFEIAPGHSSVGLKGVW
jgi:hypothetical protein